MEVLFSRKHIPKRNYDEKVPALLKSKKADICENGYCVKMDLDLLLDGFSKQLLQQLLFLTTVYFSFFCFCEIQFDIYNILRDTFIIFMHNFSIIYFFSLFFLFFFTFEKFFFFFYILKIFAVSVPEINRFSIQPQVIKLIYYSNSVHFNNIIKFHVDQPILFTSQIVGNLNRKADTHTTF